MLLNSNVIIIFHNLYNIICCKHITLHKLVGSSGGEYVSSQTKVYIFFYIKVGETARLRAYRFAPRSAKRERAAGMQRIYIEARTSKQNV